MVGLLVGIATIILLLVFLYAVTGIIELVRFFLWLRNTRR